MLWWRIAAYNSQSEWISWYQDVAGVRPLTIGVHSGNVLRLGDDGQVWGGFDSTFGPLGATPARVAGDLLADETPAYRLDVRDSPDWEDD